MFLFFYSNNIKNEYILNGNRGNINNPAQLLQGKVPGLNIVVPQGNPNGAYNIRLRGLSTIGANTQPLIIIDGVIGSDLNSIDPNDIESIDILKDGGAAAIYGTRGSSGVIIIQTKTGKTNQSRIDYSLRIQCDLAWHAAAEYDEPHAPLRGFVCTGFVLQSWASLPIPQIK